MFEQLVFQQQFSLKTDRLYVAFLLNQPRKGYP